MAFAKRKNRALNKIMREKRRDHVRESAAVASSDVRGGGFSQNFDVPTNFDIPTNYGDVYVRTIPRDPSTTFVYWEMPEDKAANCGVPVRGGVHTQNHKADWIKDRVRAHIEVAPPQDNFVSKENYIPKHIPQTQEPTFAHEQNFTQGQDLTHETAQPPSASAQFDHAPSHTPHDHSSQEFASLAVPTVQKIEPKVIGPTIPSIYENYQQQYFSDDQNSSAQNRINNTEGINTLSSESLGGESIQHNMSMQSQYSAMLELTAGTSHDDNLRAIIANSYKFTFDFIIRDSAQKRDGVYDVALSSTMLHAVNQVENQGGNE